MHMRLYTCTENPYKIAMLSHLWPFESEPGVCELWAWVGGTIDMLDFTFLFI